MNQGDDSSYKVTDLDSGEVLDTDTAAVKFNLMALDQASPGYYNINLFLCDTYISFFFNQSYFVYARYLEYVLSPFSL